MKLCLGVSLGGFSRGLELKVPWQPDRLKRNVERAGLLGEVLGSTIYIYERDVGEAVGTLRLLLG